MPDSPQEKRFDVRFADETRKELRRIGPSGSAEILAAVRKKLTAKPEEYGEPLRKDLVGYRKLPVGQWRVAYHVENDRVTVLVLAVGKRAQGDHENIYDQITGEDLDSRLSRLRRQLEDEEKREGVS